MSLVCGDARAFIFAPDTPLVLVLMSATLCVGTAQISTLELVLCFVLKSSRHGKIEDGIVSVVDKLEWGIVEWNKQVIHGHLGHGNIMHIGLISGTLDDESRLPCSVSIFIANPYMR